MGHCQPARHNNRQLTAYEKVLLFSGLTIAGSCGELGELVSDGLIIRLSQVRVLVGPPIKSKDLGRMTLLTRSPHTDAD